MKHVKIKVLKDTPFDSAGTELTLDDFRLKYSYICTNDVTNDGLINYIGSWNKDTGIGAFFALVDYPLDFIYEGYVYKKELDGFYHKFFPGVPFIKENSLGKITVSEAEAIFRMAKFRKQCTYLSDKVDKKL
jgi:hypothetical protein